MIAEFQASDRDPALAAPSLYALGLDHSHLNEMQHIAGLDHPPVFTPILSDMYSGMSTSVPLQNHLLRGRPTAEDVCEMMASYYEGQALVTVAPFGKNGPRLASNAFAGTDRWRSPYAATESRPCSPPGLTIWARAWPRRRYRT